MRKIRTVFISDLHLGISACKSEFLINFLKHIGTPKHIFLVGDIIDLWRLRVNSWSQEHNNILQQFLNFTKRGCKVTYITGNHDEYFRDFENFTFGEIEVKDYDVFITSSGKKIKIIHGDQYDSFLTKFKFMGHIGSWAYDVLIDINTWYNQIRRKFGFKYWSLAQFLKEKTKIATNVVHNFETILVDTIKKKGYNGVICGHIHMPTLKHFGNFVYMNCGDWTENCTAIIEYSDGDIELIKYENNELKVMKTWKQNLS